MRDLRKELIGAMDLLDEAHNAVLESNDPQKINGLMGIVKERFQKAQDILFEVLGEVIKGDKNATSILVDLTPRAEQSVENLKKSQAHVLKVFTIATGFHTTDASKLPRA